MKSSEKLLRRFGSNSPSVAVIGAGIAGITAATQLTGLARVTVFEKSRGFGGRMAVRRSGHWQFDHGAQFFTARSPEFRDFISEFVDSQAVAEWQTKVVTLLTGRKPFKRELFEPHYVAIPAMNDLVKQMASDLDVRLETRVHAIKPTDRGWSLRDNNDIGLGHFDFVVTAMPAPQCLELLPAGFSGAEQLESVQLSPCFALMLGYEHSIKLNFGAAVLHNSPLAWIAVNATRPGRGTSTALLLHSSNEWAEENLDRPTEEIQQEMLSALQEFLGEKVSHPDYLELHRWRYARAEKSPNTETIVDVDMGLAACGDWCLGNRVEDAFLSGLKTAAEIGKSAKFSTAQPLINRFL